MAHLKRNSNIVVWLEHIIESKMGLYDHTKSYVDYWQILNALLPLAPTAFITSLYSQEIKDFPIGLIIFIMISIIPLYIGMFHVLSRFTFFIRRYQRQRKYNKLIPDDATEIACYFNKVMTNKLYISLELFYKFIDINEIKQKELNLKKVTYCKNLEISIDPLKSSILIDLYDQLFTLVIELKEILEDKRAPYIILSNNKRNKLTDKNEVKKDKQIRAKTSIATKDKINLYAIENFASSLCYIDRNLKKLTEMYDFLALKSHKINESVKTIYKQINYIKDHGTTEKYQIIEN